MVKEKLIQVWPEWEIGQQLGRGSYGVVYQAVRRDNNIHSNAAIKVITIPSDSSELASVRSEGLTEDGAKTYFRQIVNDFVDEIRLMESLKGVQNIVSVEDYKVVEHTNEVGWDIYIRMELLTPFNNYVCDKQLTEKDVIKLGIDICTALEICSHRRIIHRDIKPENIFINDFGYYKLGDFGVARTLENAASGLSQKGTYSYMAPEVVTGGVYDATVDIYSLGIVLYKLLNRNRLPFIETDRQLLDPNERKFAVERRIRGDQLAPPCDASAQTAAVILKACAYNSQQRFATATEMKEALLQANMGTYQISQIDLDTTVRVRQAPAPAPAPSSLMQKSAPVATAVQIAEKKKEPPVQSRKTPASVPLKNELCIFALASCGLPFLFAIIFNHATSTTMEYFGDLLAFVSSFVPLLLSNIARRQTKRTGTTGNGMALAALIIGIILSIGLAQNFSEFLRETYAYSGVGQVVSYLIEVVAILTAVLASWSYAVASKADKTK